MAKSLIRKNQLHPDIFDLVSGYGDQLFITINELNQAISTISNVVFTSGNQIISGVKNFTSRPTFNGSGFAITGELGGGSTNFNGNRKITANVIGFKDLTPGGDDVVSFLNNLFYPFIPASISLNAFPTQELGTTISSINFNGAIITGSLRLDQFTNVEAFVNDVSRIPLLIPIVQNFNNIWNVGVNLNSTSSNVYIKATGVDENNNPIEIKSNIRSIVFEAPSYAGSGVDNLQTDPSNMITALSTDQQGTNNGKLVIQKPGSIQMGVYTNTNWVYFVYPNSWGPLSSISNPQFGPLSISTDFVTGAIDLPLANNVFHPYRYYKRSIPTTVTNYPLIYTF